MKCLRNGRTWELHVLLPKENKSQWYSAAIKPFCQHLREKTTTMAKIAHLHAKRRPRNSLQQWKKLHRPKQKCEFWLVYSSFVACSFCETEKPDWTEALPWSMNCQTLDMDIPCASPWISEADCCLNVGNSKLGTFWGLSRSQATTERICQRNNGT